METWQVVLEWSKVIVPSVCAGGVAVWLGLRQLGIAKVQADIAKAQAENAREKLRLDLFDRRYAIYHRMIGMVSAAFVDLNSQSEKVLAFVDVVYQAQFLFDPEVEEKLKEILERTVAVRSDLSFISAHEKTGKPATDSINDAARRVNQYNAWAMDKVREITPMLKPYLDFHALR